MKRDGKEKIDQCLNCTVADCQGACRRNMVQGTKRKRNRLYEINGVEDTLSGWARRYGIRRQTVYERMRAGATIRQALDMPVRRQVRELDGRKHILTARGRTLDLIQWAKLLGVKRMALYMRLRNHGFDIEETVAYYEKKTGVVIDAQASGATSGGGDQPGTV